MRVERGVVMYQIVGRSSVLGSFGGGLWYEFEVWNFLRCGHADLSVRRLLEFVVSLCGGGYSGCCRAWGWFE